MEIIQKMKKNIKTAIIIRITQIKLTTIMRMKKKMVKMT